MSELFSNPSGRIFALYGNTDDYFITPQLRELNIAQWLLAHLQHLGYQRIIYYSKQKKIHYLDKKTAQLAQRQQKKTLSPTNTAKTVNSKLAKGAMGHARLQRNNNGENTQKIETTSLTTDDLRWDFGSLHDSEVFRTLDKWMKEDIRTAIVFLSGEDIFHHLDQDAVRDWDDTLSSWATANFSMDNRNLAIFVFSNEINIPDILPKLQSVLVTLNEGNQQPRPERCFFIGAAKQDEVRSLLHRRRLQKKLGLTPIQIEQCAVSLAQNLTPEKLAESIKTLAHLNYELTSQKGIFSQQSPWETLKNLDGLGTFIEPKLRALVRIAKTKLARSGQTQELFGNHHITRLRHHKSINNDKLANLHLALLGNPGTGKTTLARIIAQIYRAEGILESGHLVEVSRKDLVAGYVGQTALNTSAAIERAMGGVLFIDEAYTLNEGGENDFGKEAIVTLLKAMSDFNGEFAVIIAGYTKEITDFIEGSNANPGLRRRFSEENRWLLQDYQPEVLFHIFCNELEQEGFQLDKALAARLPDAFGQWHKMREKQFGNAGEVKNLVQSLVSSAFERGIVTEEDFASLPVWNQCLGLHTLPRIEEILKPLNNLVGLDGIRARLTELCNSLIIQQKRTKSLIGVDPGHYVFTGNPGTGKTTVAQLMGNMFHQLGLLQKNHVHSVKAADLVGQYVGDAEKNTLDALHHAQHGVLFIDEAYQLTQDDSPYGKKVIETLIAPLVEQSRQLCVIVAGYPEEMERFIASDPGLISRFEEPIVFSDYEPQQLLAIALNQFNKERFYLKPEAKDRLLRFFEFEYANRKKGFGNARDVGKLIKKIKSRQASRLLSTNLTETDENLNTIEADDIPRGTIE